MRAIVTTQSPPLFRHSQTISTARLLAPLSSFALFQVPLYPERVQRSIGGITVRPILRVCVRALVRTGICVRPCVRPCIRAVAHLLRDFRCCPSSDCVEEKINSAD